MYFIFTIPITALIVGAWVMHDRYRERKNAQEDEDLEKNITKMEVDIMAMMRRKTLSKASTWSTANSPR